MFHSFMLSIVCVTPNLEELGFHDRLQLSDFLSIADDLNGFPHLRHLYYKCFETTPFNKEERITFTSQARDLAEAVLGLVSITNVTGVYLT